MKHLFKLELLITQVQSLKTKFRTATPTPGTDAGGTSDNSTSDKPTTTSLSPDVETFISDVIEQAEVTVVGASHSGVGRLIHGLFTAAQKV